MAFFKMHLAYYILEILPKEFLLFSYMLRPSICRVLFSVDNRLQLPFETHIKK
jgi:hypothetical protein